MVLLDPSGHQRLAANDLQRVGKLPFAEAASTELMGKGQPALVGSRFPWSNVTTSSPARHARFGGIGVPIRVMGVQPGASLAGKLSCESLSISSDSGVTRDRKNTCLGCWSEVARTVGLDGLTDPAGEVTGRGVIDHTAELCPPTFDTALATLGGAFLVGVTSFAVGMLAFIVRCTVVFVAVLLAFVVSLAGCVTNAVLPVIFLAFAACLAGRGAAVALLTERAAVDEGGDAAARA